MIKQCSLTTPHARHTHCVKDYLGRYPYFAYCPGVWRPPLPAPPRCTGETECQGCGCKGAKKPKFSNIETAETSVHDAIKAIKANGAPYSTPDTIRAWTQVVTNLTQAKLWLDEYKRLLNT